MLNGHAYSRAVRGHTLIQSVIAGIVYFSVTLDCDEEKYLKELACNVGDNDFIHELNREKFRKIKKKFLTPLDSIECSGPTDKLWLQYISMLTILKQFIAAERPGDWRKATSGMYAKYVTIFLRFWTFPIRKIRPFIPARYVEAAKRNGCRRVRQIC